MTIQILKLYRKSWPKFLKHVSKKVPTPRTLELGSIALCIDEKSTFEFFALFYRIKRGWIYQVKENKKLKMDYSSKTKGSNVRDFFIVKNTVHPS